MTVFNPNPKVSDNSQNPELKNNIRKQFLETVELDFSTLKNAGVQTTYIKASTSSSSYDIIDISETAHYWTDNVKKKSKNTNFQKRLEDKLIIPRSKTEGKVFQKSATGSISVVGQSYCLINYDITQQDNYNIEQPEKTTESSSIFFYQLDYFGNHQELQVGEMVQFDVVENLKSGIYVAKNVHRI
jgi:hypothetical protein